MKIAIMQPYLFPYAGYFRLFTADLFVIYDCVQFTRRGRVHRAEMEPGKWLTLPLKKLDRTVRIRDLEWANDPMEQWYKQIRKFPVLRDHGIEIGRMVHPEFTPLEIIISSLAMVAEQVGLEVQSCCSSELNIPDEIRGQERILAICEHFKADTYINSPGGRELYDEESFAKRGVKLEFLPDYHGSKESILKRIATGRAEEIKREIMENL